MLDVQRRLWADPEDRSGYIATKHSFWRRAVAGEDKLIPAEAHGVKLMSIGFMVKPDQPLIWRGPMLHSAIRQFLSDVEWGELDYLVVDLPPGTGDAGLSLALLSFLITSLMVLSDSGSWVIFREPDLARIKKPAF